MPHPEKTSEITRNFAVYSFDEFLGHVEVSVQYTGDVRTFESFRVFDTMGQAREWAEKNEKICSVMEIMEQFSTEMEGYSYFGSNPGVPEDVFDDVAEAIIKKFDI